MEQIIKKIQATTVRHHPGYGKHKYDLVDELKTTQQHFYAQRISN